MLTDPSMLKILNPSMTPNEFFIYDGVTGTILSAEKSPTGQIREAVQTYIDDKEPHVHGHEKIEWPMHFQDYQKKINTDLETLVLQLTQRCNMACTYCVYSGHYGHMRTRKNEDMSYEVIGKSIDYFLTHSRPEKARSVIFYGGEAMLCFDRIKWAVAYVHKKNPEKNIRFSISANGLILFEEHLEWLSRNEDVSVLITLNGERHDTYRLTVSGAGSLDVVLSNIENAKRNYPEVWRNQIGFIANINESDELDALERFYRPLGKFPNLITKISTVHGDSYISEQIKKNVNADWINDGINNNWLQRYIKHDDAILKAYFDTLFYEIHHRYISADRISIVHSCLPMEVSLFVRTDGNFNMCTRVTDNLELGNIYTGYNENSLRYLYEGMIEFSNNNCRRCWAQRICGYCFQDLLDINGHFYTQLPDNMCKRMQDNAYHLLNAYCDIALSQPDRVKEWTRWD